MSRSDENPRRIRLHYEGARGLEHSLPADVLVKSLRQVQHIVYLLAKLHRGDEHGQRVRFSYDLTQRFALICRMPEAGSYALPVDIGDLSVQAFPGNGGDDGDIVEVSELFHRVSRAVNAGDFPSLCREIPDNSYRKSLIKAYKKTQPPKRSGIAFSIEDYKHRKLFDESDSTDAFAKLDSRSEESDSRNIPAYVTGTLVRIDFKGRRLQMKLLSGHILRVSYSNKCEFDLPDHPRELIQAHGNVTYDEYGTPTSLTCVDRIVEVDKSPIEIREVVFGGAHYRADPPLRFEVSFNPEDQLYDLDGEFDINLSAETRPQLKDDLDDSLAMLWAEYAQEDRSRLSPKAQDLRNEILGRFRETGNGS